MLLNLRYAATLAVIIPFLPYLIFKAKRIRKSVPVLPEADGTVGSVGSEATKNKVLFIGESTIAGVGVKHHKDSIAGKTAQYLSENLPCSITWEVLARSGYRTREVIGNLLKRLATDAPQLVIIGMGGNDTFQLTSPLRFQKELRKITKQLQLHYPGTPIVITSLPPVSLFPALEGIVAKLLGIIVSLHAKSAFKLHDPKKHIYVMPSMLKFEEWEAVASSPIKELFADGVHPSGYTYDLWAQTIACFVEEHRLI